MTRPLPHRHPRLVLFGLILGLTYLAYAPGLTGSLFYDDFANLDRLQLVRDLASAGEFVLGGTAGPTGRPLALASFLPHAAGWPDNVASVLRVNVLIHLINGGLLLVLGTMLLRLGTAWPDSRCHWIALAAAALWLVMPLLASTSLIAVQRMTSLSALFVLAGLIGFVAGYRWQDNAPVKAFRVQMLSLGLGTLLAVLAKESGALLPVYALVIDRVLSARQPGARWLILTRQTLLWLGLLAILAYLSPLHRDWLTVDLNSGWSPLERFLTQTVLWWRYLALALFPKPTDFGPFHDDVGLIAGWLPLLALGGFALLVLTAALIRRRTPWLLFALLWFLAGHLLESTVLNLELMFEHRNYLAVYGLCLALAIAAWHLPGRLRSWGPALLSVYIVVQSAILYGATSIWGNPLEAGENWVRRHPDSSRAILHLSEQHYRAFGNPGYALLFLDHAASGCPRCTDVRMQALLYACRHEAPQRILDRFQTVRQSASEGQASVALLDSLYIFHDLDQGACPPLQYEDLSGLMAALLNNPEYQKFKYRIHALYHAAWFAVKLQDVAAARAYLAQAEMLAPHVMPILRLQVSLHQRMDEPEAALAAIARRRPLERADTVMTDAMLDSLEQAVRAGAMIDADARDP